VTELERVSAALEGLDRHPEPGQAARLAGSLPEAWSVEANGTIFRVSATQLRAEISFGNPASWRRARRRLETMEEEAAAFDRQRFDPGIERTKLNAILARREFRHVSGPTWIDRLKQRVIEFIASLLGRLFGSSAFPAVTRVVVWALVAVAVAVLAVMAFRMLRRSARFDSILPPMPPVPAKKSGSWAAEARAAAGQGNWREAVRCAYWAAISLLEERGLWRPDRARTPREYLGLLPASDPNRSALTALTRRFEVVWYGYQEAGEEIFAQTMAELERLGCR
jgi:hypothetical protein